MGMMSLADEIEEERNRRHPGRKVTVTLLATLLFVSGGVLFIANNARSPHEAGRKPATSSSSPSVNAVAPPTDAPTSSEGSSKSQSVNSTSSTNKPISNQVQPTPWTPTDVMALKAEDIQRYNQCWGLFDQLDEHIATGEYAAASDMRAKLIVTGIGGISPGILMSMRGFSYSTQITSAIGDVWIAAGNAESLYGSAITFLSTDPSYSFYADHHQKGLSELAKARDELNKAKSIYNGIPK